MGAFFTNIHVRLAAEGAERQLSALSETLSAAAGRDGYRSAEEGEQADRTIILAHTASPTWAVIYDEDSDAQDLRALEQLARSVSAEHIALSVLVNDSDELVLTLFRNGRKADRLRFNPAEDVRPRLKTKIWREVLGDRVVDLERILAGRGPFAEEPIQLLANVLGWDERYAFLGFNHRDELPATGTELRFVLRPEAKFYTRRAGPPNLREFAGTIGVRVTLAQAADGFGFSAMFYNEGGASRGLSALLCLTPELEEFVEIDGIQLWLGDTETKITQQCEVVTTTEAKFLRAQFPFVTLNAWPDADRKLSDAETSRLGRALNEAKTTVAVLARPKRTGTFAAELYVFPHENRREGADIARFKVEICEKPWWRGAK